MTIEATDGDRSCISKVKATDKFCTLIWVRSIYTIPDQCVMRDRIRAKTISGVMAVRHSIRLCHAHSDFMQGEQGSGMRSEFGS